MYHYVPESIRTDKTLPPPVIESSMEDDSPKVDLLDFDKFLLVMGVMQLQMLQLPIQPRRFAQWTVAPRKF